MSRVLFEGEIDVHYGFIDLTGRADNHPPELIEARAGQRNGICGAAVPGFLSMVTGLHTGPVRFTMEWHETEPPPDDRWEDVVEVSFQPPGTELQLLAFDHTVEVALPAAPSLRARFCASGMDAAQELDTVVDDDPAPDSYLLALWPAPPAPEAVLRQTSAAAAHWHRTAQAAD